MVYLSYLIVLVILIIMVINVIKSKKVWSGKKILLSFLLVGFIAGLFFNFFIWAYNSNYFSVDSMIRNLIDVIGVSEVFAGSILLVRRIKNNQKIKEEKISKDVTNILD